MHPVSERLRDARERSGLSQADLARAALMHPSYVSHLERGIRGPGPAALERLATALGITVTYLEQGERSPAYQASEAAVVRARQLVRSGRPGAAAAELAAVDLDALDVDQAGRVLLAHADALDRVGELEEAYRLLAEATQRFTDGHRAVRAAQAAARLVMALTQAGELTPAVQAGEHHLVTLADAASGSDALFRLESTVVWAYVARGDTMYALVRGKDLLARALQDGSARAVSAVHWNLAFVEDAHGHGEEALGHLRAALAIAGADEADNDVPLLRLDLAQLLLQVTPPRPKEALVELDAARLALEISESGVDLARAATFRSRALLMLGQPRAALTYAVKAVELIGPGDRRDGAAAHEVLGDALLASGERVPALKAYREAAARLESMPPGRPAATAWRSVADRLRTAGDSMEAVVEAYGRALGALGTRTTLRPPTGR
ncbi:helix-turn-helix domain-containing protein [Cellulomonas shaoxiangyii]|uniref:XRE family transcriptional regulator n=1 Tax=Cellulomonas shaoxiangyii TaxID=2566013 RepID=A0A4P7SKS0_9CELL|nr:helix-turn-helix transcriptional regulator [Cellulomonas shaoxiangyii]QCB94481.1 XRE family transcriptional regulator [Cellulomonas shaoxiangyii]TGY86063.1 XRE family transcriptional regulator [Cellulomonas shaoxiangyii]